MPPVFHQRMTRKRAVVTLWLGFWLGAATVQGQQFQGRVIDRNGAPQAGCQIEFTTGRNQPPVYRATSNRDGSFYISNARPGTYLVQVRSGQRQFAVTVSIDSAGLRPSTLVANW